MGVNFDTGNFLRVLDDPVQAMEKLAPYVFATHIKDLKPVKGVPVNEWYFFSCVPTGEGLIDNGKLAAILNKHNYQGFLAVETDFLHPDYSNQEEDVVKKSIQALRNHCYMKKLNIGIAGYKFMGRAHSNAWKKAPLFLIFRLNWF